MTMSFREEPPLFIRTLRLIIPVFATSLIITTACLFHLMHHNPSGDVSDLDNFSPGQHEIGEANSVGGAAVRHKMDLAHFLLQKFNKGQSDKGQKEAMELGGWKGGNEDNFIKLVKETGIRHGNETDTNGVSHEPLSQKDAEAKKAKSRKNDKIAATANEPHPHKSISQKNAEVDKSKSHKSENIAKIGSDGTKTNETSVTKLTWQQLQLKLVENNLLPAPIPLERTVRGFSGLPPDQTPALSGSRRGHIHCQDTLPAVEGVLSSMLAFWNDPPGTRDRDAGYPNVEPHPFVAPPLSREEAKNPKVSRRRYLTFEPDGGGWNNLRMSFECIVVFAAVMGRTLVLPPEQNVYLLFPSKNDTRKERGFYDYYKLNTDLQRRVPIITSEEFLKLEGGEDGLVPLGVHNSTYQELLWEISRSCENRWHVAELYCGHLYDHFLYHGFQANVTTGWPHNNCVVFDVDVFNHGDAHISKLSQEMTQRIKTFCREGPFDIRQPFYYNRVMHESNVVHFTTIQLRWRLLVHHYAFIFFTDPKIGNYYKVSWLAYLPQRFDNYLSIIIYI